jgi:hypothetical protein
MPSDPLLAAVAESTEATPADLTRLRARIQARQAAPSRSWLPVAAPAFALAAAALVAIVVVDREPEPVAASFSGATEGTVTVAPGVDLTLNGTGELSGTESAPRLAWASGKVEVSVEPGAGLDVQVHTDEALVKVVGTVFEVERGPLGTTVGVTRGKVSVTCSGSDEQFLTAEHSATCLPTTAPGLLGRARALHDAGAGSSAVMETLELGLNRSPAPAIHTELSALRVALLAEGADPAAAVQAAREHLSRADAGRRAEVARVGAALGYALSGCEGAMPFVPELPAEEVAASALSMCQEGGSDVNPG